MIATIIQYKKQNIITHFFFENHETLAKICIIIMIITHGTCILVHKEWLKVATNHYLVLPK
jgi:hypothetical protein